MKPEFTIDTAAQQLIYSVSDNTQADILQLSLQ